MVAEPWLRFQSPVPRGLGRDLRQNQAGSLPFVEVGSPKNHALPFVRAAVNHRTPNASRLRLNGGVFSTTHAELAASFRGSEVGAELSDAGRPSFI